MKHAKPIVDFFIGNISDNENIMVNMINSIKSGLLNISNSTLEIIFILKEIIPIVRKIDTSGFVLDSCLKETRNYFRQFRKDLNSALLKFLIHHKSFDFTLKDFEEQQKSKFGVGLEYPPPTHQADWKPDPIYVKTFINPDIRTSDPINVLISHLSTSSSSSLAEFYQKQLSERLLKVDSIEEIEAIVEEVEMFRNKCGESFVTSLNIMINDIIESRSKTVSTSDSSDFKMTIISHRYWPEIIEKDLSHPEFILEKLSSISSTYSRQQEDKKIIWRPQLDEVKVSLEFPSGIFLFSCPLEAAILINSFDFPADDPEEEFDLGMTVALTGISDKKLLKNAMRFWLKKRVILSSRTTQFHFRFAQDYDPKESDCIDHSSVLFDKTEAETFADDDESSEPDFSIFKEKYWSIIANMLKTFGQISAERIQSTLKMYSKEYSGSLDVLTKFLQSRVKEGVLQSNGNRIILYSLLNKH